MTGDPSSPAEVRDAFGVPAVQVLRIQGVGG